MNYNDNRYSQPDITMISFNLYQQNHSTETILEAAAETVEWLSVSSLSLCETDRLNTGTLNIQTYD